jgi:hypothetical protein
MRNIMALVTRMAPSSMMKIPGVPVGPDVVASVYLPRKRSPIESGFAAKDLASLSVTSRAVAHSSKRAIRVFLSVGGRTVASSTLSGTSLYRSR